MFLILGLNIGLMNSKGKHLILVERWILEARLRLKKTHRDSGKVSEGIGGGMCRFTNLLHWMILHKPLTIVEHHHHGSFDLFPDFGRQVPFGTGTSVCYNHMQFINLGF